VLIVAAGASLVAGLDLIDVADLVLPAAFVLLGGAMAYGVGATAISRAGLATKSLVTALGLVLLLPLLWAPVLAVLGTAAGCGSGGAYFTAHAGVRGVVRPVIFTLGSLFTESPLATAVWSIFQVAASVIGFLASMVQVWKALRGFLYGDDGDGDVQAA